MSDNERQKHKRVYKIIMIRKLLKETEIYFFSLRYSSTVRLLWVLCNDKKKGFNVIKKKFHHDNILKVKQSQRRRERTNFDFN